jgi:hypothetical protein
MFKRMPLERSGCDSTQVMPLTTAYRDRDIAHTKGKHLSDRLWALTNLVRTTKNAFTTTLRRHEVRPMNQ